MSDTIQIPANFKYREVLLKGRPVHDRHSSFYAKHPPMPPSRWAKIFSPFDALKGFSDAVASKNELYEYKRILNEDSQQELGRRLEILKNLTWNSRMAKENHITASIIYYSPCYDQQNEAYGYKGQYKRKTGIVWKVDTEFEKTIKIDNYTVKLKDIVKIEAENIFDRRWEVVL